MKKNIAFLGMGTMGRHMAANLARSGDFAVYVWNRNRESNGLKFAQSNGCIAVPDFLTIAETCSVICVCLSEESSVKDVLLGKGGLASMLPKGATIIDFSTIGKHASIYIADKLSQQGIQYLDAPVSGGDVGARNGTLSIMVGGVEKDCVNYNNLFGHVGSKVFYCGRLGDGQAIKSINQLICAVNLVAVCEALTAAKVLGLNPKKIVEVCSSGAAHSWALSNLGPQIVNADFSPGFMVKHMIKDLEILNQELSSRVNLPVYQYALERFYQTGKMDGESGLELGTQALFNTYQMLNSSIN